MFLFAALRMQRGLLILFREFHARSISSHSILIADPSFNQPVRQRWLSFEMFWLRQGALFSWDSVEVMIRWRPVVSLASLVQSRLLWCVCQSNSRWQWICLCEYFSGKRLQVVPSCSYCLFLQERWNRSVEMRIWLPWICLCIGIIGSWARVFDFFSIYVFPIIVAFSPFPVCDSHGDAALIYRVDLHLRAPFWSLKKGCHYYNLPKRS